MTDEELDQLAVDVRRQWGDRFPVPGRDESASERDLREEITRDGLVGVVAVLHRDDGVVVAPHDEGGETRREVDAVHGADGLAARVDDRPEGPEERPAVLGLSARR